MLSIVKRNSVYYFRQRIPTDMRKHFHAVEIVRSLRTKLYRKAKSLAAGKLGDLERVFMTIRSGVLTDDEIVLLVDKYKREQLAKSEVVMDTLMACSGGNMKATRMALTEHFGGEAQTVKDVLLDLRGMDELVVHTAHILLNERGADGVNIASYSPEFKSLCRAVALANKEINNTLIQRNETGDSDYDRAEIARRRTVEEVLSALMDNQLLSGETVHVSPVVIGDDITVGGAVSEPKKGTRHTLKQAIESFIDSKKEASKKGKIKVRGLDRYDEVKRAILECILCETGKDDVFLDEIDYEFTKKLILRFQQYPYRRSDRKHMTLDEIYQSGDWKTNKPSTVNKGIGKLSDFFNHALAIYKGELYRNCVPDLSDLLDPEEDAAELKDPFRKSDIAEIVRELAKRKVAGEFIHSPHLEFIPMIGLLQGMRPNEICQLSVNDIVKVGKHWCFKITEDLPDQSVKNANSKRVNPIHPSILKMGIVEFRDQQRSKGRGRLWEFECDTLPAKERVRRKVKAVHSCALDVDAGIHSVRVTRWFNTTIKNSLKLSNPAKQTFYSTRHSFADWLQQNLNISEHGQAITALMGHLSKADIEHAEKQGYDAKAETFKRYGEAGLNIDKQFETLKHLDYGVDLTPLFNAPSAFKKCGL